jgi:hypothetical protein
VNSFPGYNLRGLIVTYLEEQGWDWDDEHEVWSRDDVRFSGPNATDLAVHEQIETEEGRARPGKAVP